MKSVLKSIFYGAPAMALKKYGYRYPFRIGETCKVCGGSREIGDGYQCICALMDRSARAQRTKEKVEIVMPSLREPRSLTSGQVKAMKAIRDMVLGDNPPKFVVISGITGAGKTVLAYAIYARFGSFGSWLGPESFGMRTQDIQLMLMNVSKPPLVVVDDLGRETTGQAPWHREALFKTINIRSNKSGGSALTLVTTNLSLGQITEISDRIADRLSPARGAAWIVLSRDDARVKEAEQWMSK